MGIYKILSNKKNVAARLFSTAVFEKPGEIKWDLYAGISLERTPITSREYNHTENKFSQILARLELENSHKSNFEIRLEEDLKRQREIKEGGLDQINLDKAQQQTGQDFLDACQEELKSFKFGSCGTEENLKSTRRALDRRLILLIKQKFGNQYLWVLPQGIYKGEDSLRLTAERVLKEKCGQKIQARFLGNCPCGFYKYKYPRYARSDSVGAQIFFFKAQLLKGQVDEEICSDFQWATRKELTTLSEDYLKTIKKFLLDEEH